MEDIWLHIWNASSQQTVAFTVGMNRHRRQLPLLWGWIFTKDSFLYSNESSATFTLGRHLTWLSEWIFKDRSFHCGNVSSQRTVAFTVGINLHRGVAITVSMNLKITFAFTVEMNLHWRQQPLLWEWIFIEDSWLYWRNESSHRRQLPLLWEWIFTEDSCLHCGNESSQKTVAFTVGMNLHKRQFPLQ